MKKTKLLVAIMLVISLLLVACTEGGSHNEGGNDNTTTNELVKLSIWSYYSGASKDVFYDMVDEFNQTVGRENNILVEPRTTGNVGKLAESIIASANGDIGAEPMPHIFMAYPDSAYKIDAMDMVLDLDPYFSSEELAEFNADFLNECRFGSEDALKIIPIAKSSEVIFINKTDFDLFASAVEIDLTLFETWEGLAQLSQQYYNWTDAKTQELDDGKAFFGIDSMANYTLIGAEQLSNSLCNISNNKVEVNLNRETAKKMWDNFYIPFVHGYYGNIGNFRSDDATTGDILAYTGSTAGASWFPQQVETGKDEMHPIEGMIMPMPTFESGELVSVHQGAGMVVTKSDAKHQDAAVLFLKWFTAPDQNSAFAIRTGYVPVKSELLTLDAYNLALEEYGADQIHPLVRETANTTYKMIETHSLYANKPYSTSYETRLVLESSLINFAKNDLGQITEEMKSEPKDSVLAKYITDENFDKWYQQFIIDLEDTMPK